MVKAAVSYMNALWPWATNFPIYDPQQCHHCSRPSADPPKRFMCVRSTKGWNTLEKMLISYFARDAADPIKAVEGYMKAFDKIFYAAEACEHL